MKLALRWLMLCTLIGACDADTPARTQVMVVVDAQSEVRARSTDVDFEVRSGTGPVDDWEVRRRQSITPGDELSWPLEVGLVPRDGDADRVFLAIATARDAEGAAVAQVRAIGGYQAGKTLSLLLLFEDACIDKADLCGPEQTCRAGVCVDAHVEAKDLPTYVRDDAGRPVSTPFWDGGRMDGGGEAGRGGRGGAGGNAGSSGSGSGMDAGPDAGPQGECARDADCDDGDGCNGAEHCAAGSCEDGEAFECPEVDQPCLRNECVNDDGEPSCEAVDADEGESCREGDESDEAEDSCSYDYVCNSGACEPETVEECEPGECNTNEGCDPDDGCIYEPRSSSTDCDDGDPCTQDDTCDGDGACEGEAYSCDDMVACTIDICDGEGACTYETSDALCNGPCKSGTCDLTMNCIGVVLTQDFSDCSDDDSGTTTDMCYRGECVGGSKGVPTNSCAVEGCGCSSWNSVKDLEYYSSTQKYVGLIDASQNGEAPCFSGSVSLVVDVTQDAITPFTTDTPNGAISEVGFDLLIPYVVSNTHVGNVDMTDHSVEWLNSVVDTARSGMTLGAVRGIGRHSEGSLLGDRYSHLWLWGTNSAVGGASRVLRCSSCSSNVIGIPGGGGGCDIPLSCVDATGYLTSSITGVIPYTYGMTLTTLYGGVIQLANLTSGANSKAIYEDQTGLDYFASSLEVGDTSGSWNGGIKTSPTGQVLVFGSGTNNLRLCNDPENDGNTSCTAITGLPNQALRSYNRAVVGSGNSAILMLANTGTAYYLLLLPVGLEPTDGNNWREVLLASSGTTANAVAAGPTGFLVLGKSGSAPFVWSWNP